MPTPAQPCVTALASALSLPYRLRAAFTVSAANPAKSTSLGTHLAVTVSNQICPARYHALPPSAVAVR